MQCDFFDADRFHAAEIERALAQKTRAAFDLMPQDDTATAKLVVAGRAGQPTFGILDDRGRGVDLRGCGLYEPGLAATFDPLHRFVSDLGIEPYDVPARQGELKHVIVTHSPAGEQLVRFVVRSRESVDLLRRALPALLTSVPTARVVTANILPEHKAVLEGDIEVALTEQVLMRMPVGEVTLLLGPRAFFQTNTAVAADLYRQAVTWADTAHARTVWDLYCGVGGFALHLATDRRRVIGVETSEEAIDAHHLTSSKHGSGTVEFIVGDVTRDLPPGSQPDLVVVNPPRRGIGERLAAWLDSSTATHLIYSSCNIESLRRDLVAMPTWHASEARLFDMFPQTTHQEVMVLLQR